MSKRTIPADVKPVNDWVDAVYVLSVRNFDVRHAHIAHEMARHDIAFSYVFEHDADSLGEELISATFGPWDMKRAHQSLVLKNIWVWQEAIAKGHRRVLVFEDDAVLAADFSIRFDEAMRAATQLAPGWMIFLGGLDTKVPFSYFRAPGPLVELPIATAEGCVHDALAMQRRLEWLSRNKVSLAADFLMRHIDAQQSTRQFWLRHPIVEQGSVLGIFDSYLDGNRQKHTRLYNILRNRWNKFQRRWLRERLAAFTPGIH
jgi:glycosyl transferase family 25